jgi:hypothetical protein
MTRKMTTRKKAPRVRTEPARRFWPPGFLSGSIFEGCRAFPAVFGPECRISGGGVDRPHAVLAHHPRTHWP